MASQYELSLLTTIAMEDAHTTLPSHTPETALFAVFDGHGGPNVALYSGGKIASRISSDPNFKPGEYGQAMTSSFLGLDVDLRAGLSRVFTGRSSVCR
jgi:protein phosphatase 2C family protein 2/3